MKLLRNNSINEWLNYNCGGGIFVNIPAKKNFEVSDEIAAVILRNLGAPTWVVDLSRENSDILEAGKNFGLDNTQLKSLERELDNARKPETKTEIPVIRKEKVETKKSK